MGEYRGTNISNFGVIRPPQPAKLSPHIASKPQLWNSAATLGARDPRVALTGYEPGLVGLWTFSEGRGTVTVDSASWRSGSGIARFGVLTPAVAFTPASSPLLSPRMETDGSSVASAAVQWPERPNAPLPAWAVSTAPSGGLVRSFDTRPSFFRINGTDAHLRPLTAVLTRAPAGGTLFLASPIGSTASDEDEKVLEVGHSVPVGARLVYRPDAGAHDPFPDSDERVTWDGGDGATEADPYDWLAYRVETEGGEVSDNEAVVALSVRPVTDTPHLSWPSKVRKCSEKCGD